MDSKAVVFLGVIAAASLVQMFFLLGLALGGWKLARKVRALQEKFDYEVRPALDTFSRVTRNVAEISDLAALQARRLDAFLADTAEKIDETASQLRRVVMRPLAPILGAVALLRSLRRGFETYQRLGAMEAQGRGAARRYGEEDEHLFI